MKAFLNYPNGAFITLCACALLYTSSVIGAAPSCETATADTLINIPTLTVRNDAAIGSEIGTSIITSPINTFACTQGFTFQEFFVKGAGQAAAQINGINIYKLGSDDSGIGYAVYGESVGTCRGFHPVAGTSPIGGKDAQRLCSINGVFSGQPIQGAMKLVFYKIGTITPGKRQSQQVGSFALRTNKNTWQHPEPRISSSAFTVITHGCFVNSAQINVPLGDVGMEELDVTGNTAAEQAFSIPLSCDTGTKVKLTLKPGSAGVYDNANGLLNLSDSASIDTAQGVKIQVLSNETPVAYGKPLDMGTQQSTGQFTISLKARYYRSPESIRAGKANSSVTYIITYE
ncbi:Fimbria adhesin protein precursor [compost metagenome]|uniref:fimbrial protein n=1 Tax=Pseudomonas sp. JUb96 TaxID=2940539 RepID=UPI000FA9C163|nr:fimbrial protein [Pseudomonas sp. JUb96]MCW2268200.1 type 1 fimbria pilin [Pseudomonas sp. JUb96]